MEDTITEKMEKQGISALGVGVIQDGEIVYARGFGYADSEKEIEADADTPFLLASVSKTFTAVAAMILYESEDLDIEENINEYLPFEIVNPEFPDEPITVKMLLTHTSSIVDTAYDELNDSVLYYRKTDPKVSLAKFIEIVLSEKGEYYSEDHFSDSSPGKKYSYSNLATALLGYIVEYVAEEDFESFCRKKIFDPLGMKNTSWRLDYYKDQSIIALPYYEPQKTKGHYTAPDFPNGMARSSVNDLCKFLLMFTNGGIYKNTRILEEETVELMREVHFTYKEDGETSQIGLIWYYEEETCIGHDGAEEGVTTRMIYDTEEEIGFVLLANLSEADLSSFEEGIYEEF